MPADQQPQFVDVGGRSIATLAATGGAPGLVWLPGFKSDMISTKAAALAAWAGEHGLACTRFDYSGHGQSSGAFEDGTLSQWIEEAAAVFTRLTRGPQIVIGSSMGGHIALMLLARLQQTQPADAARITGLLLIAPAWNMTEELMWKRFAQPARDEITERGVWLRPSAYGEPYAITRGLIEDGRRQLIGDQWDPGHPVRIIHGKLDPDVPWQHSLALRDKLAGDRVNITWVEDGEHRLSRPEDLALMFRELETLISDGRRTA